MATRFSVQGRVIVRRHGRIVRDEARSSEVSTRAEASSAARDLAAEGFTAWVFELRDGAGVTPVYTLVERLDG
jgi:hypothetical protein